MKKHIPNTITLINLFSGCCAVVCILSGQYTEGAVFIGISLLADFLDGLAARVLRVNSLLGVQLDSLADMVSFGVVPGVIVFELLKGTSHEIAFAGWQLSKEASLSYSTIPAFIITLFSCLRLAKFNIDTRQTTSFIGLNTPSNTVFFTGIMLTVQYNTLGLGGVASHPILLYSLIPVSSYLLVSEIRMFSMKGGLNKMKIVYIAISAVSLILFREVALSLNMVMYIIFNIVNNYFFNKMTSVSNHAEKRL